MKNDEVSPKLEMLESLFSDVTPATAAGDSKSGPEEFMRILLEYTSELRKKKAECAANESLVRTQMAQIKGLRESEAKLREETEILKVKLLKQIEENEADRRVIEELRSQTRLHETSKSANSERLLVLEAENAELVTEASELRRLNSELSQKAGELEAQLKDENQRYVDAAKRSQEEANRKLAQLADSKWELELAVGELRQEKIEMSTRLQQAVAEADSYAQNYHHLQEEVSSLRVEVATKEGELAQLRQRFDYEIKIREAMGAQAGRGDVLREARQDFMQEIARIKSEASDEIRSLKAERTRLEGELVKASEGVAVLRRDLLKGQAEIEQIRLQAEKTAQIKAAEAAHALHGKDLRIEGLENTCKALEREIKRVTASEEKLRAELADVEAKFRAADIQWRNDSSLKQAEFNQALSTKETRIQDLRSTCEALERECLRISESEQRTKDEWERVEARLRGSEESLRAEFLKMQAEGLASAAQLAVAREQLQALRAEQQRTASELETSIKTINGLREALIERQAEIHAAKEAAANELLEFKTSVHRDVSEARARAEIAESQLNDARAKIRLLDGALAGSEREVAERQARITSLLQEVEAKSKALDDERVRGREYASQLELRENQLRVYAGLLAKEKAEVQRAAKNLVKEIRMLSNTHPLKDYVAATEFELSKVEVQLKSTPTLAAERVKLEEYLEKLVEQRDFLKKVLIGSQSQFENQALGIERMINSSALAPVPPPPPPLTAAPKAKPATAKPAESPALLAIEPRWEKPLGTIN